LEEDVGGGYQHAAQQADAVLPGEAARVEIVTDIGGVCGILCLPLR